MNYYLIAKFIHIVGALGLFIALGMEWFSLMNLRHSTHPARISEWLRIAGGSQKLGAPSMAATVLSGFYMMAVARMHAAWLVVAFGSLVVLALLAILVTRRRMAAIARSMDATAESPSPSLRQFLRAPLLWIVTQLRFALALGIVFLMTLKPDLLMSLLSMGIAVILGLMLALSTVRREQERDGTDQTKREFYQA